MKNTIKTLLLVMVLVLALAAFTGCELLEKECTHEGTTELIPSVIPTCTETGMSLGTKCTKCGAVVLEPQVTPVRGHDKTTLLNTTADCLNAGVETWNCGFCGEDYDVEVEAYGHDLVEVEAKAPACTEEGYNAHKACANCDYTEGKEVVEATGHSLVDVEAKAATCTEDGYNAHKGCENCDYTEGKEVVEATGHSLVDVEAKAATCTEEGYTAHKACENCDYTEGKEAVAATGHSYTDGICGTCGATDPDHYFVVTIPEALEKADGSKVEVSGTVCAINTAWSDSYGNISVTIVDAEGNELYVYRMKTNVALGDVITVKGAMGTYNGRQIAAGSTATITGHDSSYDYKELSIEEAIAVADNTNVIVTGTVVKINTAYSSNYKNISVTISDDNGTQLYIYRLAGGSDLAVGDIITIKGAMATYSGSRQITGGTYEEVGTHTCSKWTEATCTKLSACVVCGATTGELASHSYVDGACSVCGAAEGVVVTVSTLEFTETNMTSFSETVSSVWEANGIKFTNAKGSYTNNLAKYNAPARIYSGTVSTIECEGMTKIVFYVNSGKAVTGLTGGLTDTANYTVNVDGYVVTVTFNAPVDSISITATAQFRLDSIEVTH